MSSLAVVTLPCIGLGLPFTWTTDGRLPVGYSSGRAAPLLRLLEKQTEIGSNVLRHKCCTKGFVPNTWDLKKACTQYSCLIGLLLQEASILGVLLIAGGTPA